jgi:aspartyl-tRNA(Asn)/glutamyl-tRNA(Gln) amidotransferase subunit C
LKKPRITQKDVRHLAWLARIELTKQEAAEMAIQLSGILDYFAKIDALKIGKIKLKPIVGLKNVTRTDEPKAFPADKILTLAPHNKGRYILAPRMT